MQENEYVDLITRSGFANPVWGFSLTLSAAGGKFRAPIGLCCAACRGMNPMGA